MSRTHSNPASPTSKSPGRTTTCGAPLGGTSNSGRSDWLFVGSKSRVQHHEEHSNSVSRHNNSWYHTEFAFEPVDTVRASAFTSEGKDRSPVATAKRLMLSDPYSLSQHPAKSGSRYSYMDSCSDTIRRDTPSLRYHSLNVLGALERLPIAQTRTSPWLPPAPTLLSRGPSRQSTALQSSTADVFAPSLSCTNSSSAPTALTSDSGATTAPRTPRSLMPILPLTNAIPAAPKVSRNVSSTSLMTPQFRPQPQVAVSAAAD